jgi:hypothetical protein
MCGALDAMQPKKPIVPRCCLRVVYPVWRRLLTNRLITFHLAGIVKSDNACSRQLRFEAGMSAALDINFPRGVQL